MKSTCLFLFTSFPCLLTALAAPSLPATEVIVRGFCETYYDLAEDKKKAFAVKYSESYEVSENVVSEIMRLYLDVDDGLSLTRMYTKKTEKEHATTYGKIFRTYYTAKRKEKWVPFDILNGLAYGICESCQKVFAQVSKKNLDEIAKTKAFAIKFKKTPIWKKAFAEVSKKTRNEIKAFAEVSKKTRNEISEMKAFAEVSKKTLVGIAEKWLSDALFGEEPKHEVTPCRYAMFRGVFLRDLFAAAEHNSGDDLINVVSMGFSGYYNGMEDTIRRARINYYDINEIQRAVIQNISFEMAMDAALRKQADFALYQVVYVVLYREARARNVLPLTIVEHIGNGITCAYNEPALKALSEIVGREIEESGKGIESMSGEKSLVFEKRPSQSRTAEEPKKHGASNKAISGLRRKFSVKDFLLCNS